MTKKIIDKSYLYDPPSYKITHHHFNVATISAITGMKPEMIMLRLRSIGMHIFEYRIGEEPERDESGKHPMPFFLGGQRIDYEKSYIHLKSTETISDIFYDKNEKKEFKSFKSISPIDAFYLTLGYSSELAVPYKEFLLTQKAMKIRMKKFKNEEPMSWFSWHQLCSEHIEKNLCENQIKKTRSVIDVIKGAILSLMKNNTEFPTTPALWKYIKDNYQHKYESHIENMDDEVITWLKHGSTTKYCSFANTVTEFRKKDGKYRKLLGE